jgi:hypothetical protein
MRNIGAGESPPLGLAGCISDWRGPAARSRVSYVSPSGGRLTNSSPHSPPDSRPDSSRRGLSGCRPVCWAGDSTNCRPGSLTDSRAASFTDSPSCSSIDCRRSYWTGCSTGCRYGSRTDGSTGGRASSSTGCRPCSWSGCPRRSSTGSLPKSHRDVHVRESRTSGGGGAGSQ